MIFPLTSCGPQPARESPGQARTQPLTWHWECLDEGLPRQVLVPTVAADPANGTIYAGLYHPASLVALPPGDQATWRSLEVPFAGAPVFQLRVSPNGQLLAATGVGLFERRAGRWETLISGSTANHRAVFATAATAGEILAATDGDGLQRHDARGRWTTILSQTILSLALGFDPASTPAIERIIYAGSAGYGIFTSHDGGDNWLGPAFPDAFVPEIAVNPADGTVAVASLRQRLVISRDGGRSWQRLPLAWTTEEVVSLLWTPDNRLYAGTGQGNLYLSRNEGESWAQLANGIPAQGGILSLAESEAGLIAGTWVGVYASPDQGQTWSYLSPGLGRPNAFTLLAGEQGLWLGAQTGLFRLDADQGAKRWQLIRTDFPGGATALAQTGDGWLLAGTAGGIYRSVDDGQTWQPAPDPHISIRQLLPVGSCVYAVATYERVYRSCDDGRQWRARWTGLGVITEVKTLGAVTSPAASHLTTLLAGTDHGLFRSGNGGEDWQPSGQSLSDQTILALLVPAGGVVLAGGTRGLYRSEDGGQTFRAGGLPEITVSVLLAHPTRPGLIVAGTAFQGLFLSSDGGQRWQAIGPPEMSEMHIQAVAWFEDKLVVAGADQVWWGTPGE